MSIIFVDYSACPFNQPPRSDIALTMSQTSTSPTNYRSKSNIQGTSMFRKATLHETDHRKDCVRVV
eukprot:3575579-Amphidinium_carterae.1